MAIIIYLNYIGFLMNSNVIEGDSLLSNISNISVKINHNKSDGSGFFLNFIHDNDNEKQIAIQALSDQQSFNHESLLQRIVQKDNCKFNLPEPQNTWVTGANAPGVSQEQNQSQVDQINAMQDQSFERQKIPLQAKVLCAEDKGQAKRLKLMIQKRHKNETKNIPKNYGKAIISFIQKYEKKVKQVTQICGVKYEDFIQQVKQKKKLINTIADLRQIWIDYKYAKCMRLLSNLFLRKYSLSYIFNSRICNFSSHIKYRYRLSQAIQEPYKFKHIKDY